MEPQKKSVSVDITKHIRKFINYAGNEITREEALGLRPKINNDKQEVDGDKKGTEEEN